MNWDNIHKRAQNRVLKIKRLEKDSRYQKTMGRLVYEKLLTHTEILPSKNFVTLSDALWAGEIEPRIYELLPAIVLKRPKLFIQIEKPPEDLRKILVDIRNREANQPFRGIPPKDYLKWIPRIGQRNKTPTVSRTFRLQGSDLDKIKKIRKKLGVTEIEVIRQGLTALEKTIP